jgi:streptogramin lyase
MIQAKIRGAIVFAIPIVFLLGAAGCDSTQAESAEARAGGIAVADWDGQPINYLPNPYETVRDWGALPDGRSWGSVSAVHVDPDGVHIWAGDRCGANSCAGSEVDPIVKLDPDGNVVASFGAGMLVWPHGMHVDRDGNVWVVDARAANARELESFPDEVGKGNAVLKFSPRGELLLTINTTGAGADAVPFSEPTDVITAPNGDIFIAEAHNGQFINEPTPAAIGRVSKYSADGTFIKSWGEWGYGPGEFRGPHALAFDTQGRLFVADRGNNRIQIFDQEGNFIEEWKQFSRISGLVIDENDILYAIDSESAPGYNDGWRKGIRIGSARTGEVQYYIPEHNSERASGMGGFGAAGEGITVDAAGNVYAGEVGPVMGLTKFVPRLLPR